MSEDVNIWEILGRKYYELKRYELAVDSFEKINNSGELYLKSKLEIAKKKDDIEEIIIWLGRLAVETNNDKEQIAAEIISRYLENKGKLEELENIYVFNYLYLAYLLKKPHFDGLLKLAIKVEHSFENREAEIAQSYLLFIKSNLLDKSILNFVLERWVKAASRAGVIINDINTEYENISIENKIPYVPFKNDEIKNIPIIPKYIIANISNHWR